MTGICLGALCAHLVAKQLGLRWPLLYIDTADELYTRYIEIPGRVSVANYFWTRKTRKRLIVLHENGCNRRMGTSTYAAKQC